MRTTTSEDIIKNLEQLNDIMVRTPNSWVSATVSMYEFQSQFIAGHMFNMPIPRTYSGMTRDEFIDMMSSLSLTHKITDIGYDATFGTTVRVELKVYVEESPDHQTNITPEVMELFYNLPIY